MNSTTRMHDVLCSHSIPNSKGADDITVAYMGTVYYASQRLTSSYWLNNPRPRQCILCIT